jgi:hypothetical protein
MRRVKVTSPTLTWGETLPPQRLTPHRARIANHLPGNAPMVDAVPASPTGAGVILSLGLLGTTYTASQMTYELRRLRLHGPNKI